jgi:hypothetical protein
VLIGKATTNDTSSFIESSVDLSATLVHRSVFIVDRRLSGKFTDRRRSEQPIVAVDHRR